MTTALFQQGFSGDVECSNTPPGVRKMVKGVDITTLDLVPLDLTSVDGYKSPIINFTCNRGQVIKMGQVKYQKPDQVGGTSTTGIE